MRRGRTALLLTFLIATAGCPGSIKAPREDGKAVPWPDMSVKLDIWTGDLSKDGTADLTPADQTGVQDKGPACKPDDAMTPCDPVKPSGCSSGQGCYLVQGKFLDCVCPAGTTAAGGSCTTTVQCQPGYACAGTAPPGACRRVCSLTSSSCPTGTTCKPIPSAPQYGLCQ
jgi:hypothetical protein